ncbi:arrestin domain-containing protein 3-like protein [Pitangus sulphuratus]|nr:arrestin domain-containing protein 3-like protein [Pitangus sulphuratus]
MQLPGRLQSLVVKLEDGPAHGSGELLHGRVQLELRGALRVRALEVSAHGGATVHWLESYSIGLNVVYRDHSACQTFLCRHCQLIPDPAGCCSVPSSSTRAFLVSAGEKRAIIRQSL